MKKAELRQLVREVIKEAYIDSKGELKRFKSIDAEEGEGTTEWLAGLQRVINLLRSIPKLKELKFAEPMVRMVKELELVYNFFVDGSEEKTKMLNSIPGNNIGQKAEMSALGTIMVEHDMIFNLYILPHLEEFNPDLPGLMDDEDDLFEELTITKFDLDAIRAAGKVIKSLGIIKEGLGDVIVKLMDRALFALMADTEEAFKVLLKTNQETLNKEEQIELLSNLAQLKRSKPTLAALAAEYLEDMENYDKQFGIKRNYRGGKGALSEVKQLIKKILAEAEVDADGNLVDFSPPNWRMTVGEYDHIHFFINKNKADTIEDLMITAGIDMVDHYPFGSKYLFRVSLGSDARGDLQKAEKIVGQRARKSSPEENPMMKAPMDKRFTTYNNWGKTRKRKGGQEDNG